MTPLERAAASLYGRSPADDSAQTTLLAVSRITFLRMERNTYFGPIPPGVTLYRKSPGVWLELPDPEKVTNRKAFMGNA